MLVKIKLIFKLKNHKEVSYRLGLNDFKIEIKNDKLYLKIYKQFALITNLKELEYYYQELEFNNETMGDLK